MSPLHPFPPRGFAYFWLLNDVLEESLIDQQIEAFVKAKIGTVCLHPRDGLLLPYGSVDWFSFIRRTAEKLARKGIEIWLYDEDPYPSGNAGGRIVLDHPEFLARKITIHRAAPEEIGEDGLWFFPAKGKLLLCGAMSKQDGEMIEDWTGRVGMIRRTWKMMKGWDSRWYYPATPLYVSDRAVASVPEYAVKVGKPEDDRTLCAFTLEESGTESTWRTYADTLNPQATEVFLQYTHEKYRECVGDMFGREITAIFTDESKYFGYTPWTPGMFEDFQHVFGYDLRPRLYDLFSSYETPQSIRTRLNYRDWCGKRFETAWQEPVSTWCRKHHLKLIGHISPEDDPVQQAATLSNLMPLQKYFSLAGLDLIIPAVGDKQHPLISVGVVSAVSSAQQHELPGVMSESLAASASDCSIENVRRILNWQTVMGMTTPVIHAIFHSLRDERQFECPPDYGPWSEAGKGLPMLADELKPIQEMLLNATQIAPVAILWPIKSFHLLNLPWQAEPGGLREELTDLLHRCLESHIGIHFLDEQDLLHGKLDAGLFRVGRATYSHLIIPGSVIWTEQTWEHLHKLQEDRIHIFQYGTKPRFLESRPNVITIPSVPFPELKKNEIPTRLPKLINFSTPDPDHVRITGWKKNGQVFFLLCYLGNGRIEAEINHNKRLLSSWNITVIPE